MSETVKFDLSKYVGNFKVLNATNGGPWHKRYTNDQWHSNFDAYKKVCFPYSRNHDSNIYSIYGGPYAHDITAIFPNFDADVNDPESYDFACTDESILTTLDAGTETYFRLGQSIEHHIKKHGTIPPKDFQKWAEICEHIIMHYNEGWADGYNLNIQYWEIWNEPDLDPDDAENKRTWGGTKAQFFDLYEIAAKHLKARFPDLKIGGPALAEKEDWAEDFLKEMRERNVPIDFFSWHVYGTTPEKMVGKAERIKKLLIENGYDKAESHLNEWNYVKGWTDQFIYSLKSIKGIKGAAFTMACICEAQKAPIDMLMYYDTLPGGFCGVFDTLTCEPLKGYYPLYWYGMFYDLVTEIRQENKLDNIYSLCGIYKEGKILSVITYYDDDDNAPDKNISVDFGKNGEYEVYLLDKEHDGELIAKTSKLRFDMKNHSVILIREI